MKKILFYVDHKFRDLPSLARIGYILKNKGYKVYFAPLWLWEVSIDKDIIVLNKPLFKNEYKKYNWNNKKIIIIESEGCNQDFPIFKRRVLMNVDLYFFWSEFEKKKYEKINHIKKKIVAGCPRMDFVNDKIYPKKNSFKLIKKKIKILNSNTKIITIATSTQEAHLGSKKIKTILQRRNSQFVQSMDYLMHVKNTKKNLNFTKEILKKIKKIIKNNYLILIKPHPNEDYLFWEKLVQNLGSNFFLLKDILINDLINISNYHIAHNGCTTIFEAKLKKIPCGEIYGPLTKKLIHKDHLNLSDDKINSINDIKKIINNIQTNKIKSKKIDHNYIKKYFFKIDNKRCDHYAKEIDLFIKTIKIEKKNKINFFYFKCKFIGIMKEIFFYLKSFIKVADQRNRYDSRIKLNDYKIWYQKFK